MDWAIYQCESCGCGSRITTHCPHCGAPAWLRHRIDHLDLPMDTECYRDYWLCRVGDKCFEMFDGYPLDIHGLKVALTTATLHTFNGRDYDQPMVSYALMGADNAQLKALSDAIITQNMKPWDIERLYGIAPFEMDMVDLFDVLPGGGSLKMYGGKLHAPKLQDLPIEPSASIGLFDRPLLREYCGNDCDTTTLAFKSMSAQLALRKQMSDEYDVDLRSKSDAQIAEAVMKKLLPFRVTVPDISVGATFNYRPPAWMRFQTPYMQQVFDQMRTLPFTINSKGGASPHYANDLVDWGDDQVRVDPHGVFVSRPQGWTHRTVRIGDTEYAMGIGGLHSTESRRCVVQDADHCIFDHDVASYYPSLILVTGIYPAQIGPVFQDIYRGWYDRRIAAKHAGDKKTANSLKTLLNGTFGKLGSVWSIFYAISEMIQVTVGGQLALFMLIEALELAGLRVISANTDGLVIYCHKNQIPMRDQIIAWWEQTTGFTTEANQYRLLASRDVNSYVAITVDGVVKTKGVFAPPEPGPSGWPNPTTQICVDAVIAYLKDGIPLEATILACTDVRQFVSIRNVKGGGSFVPNKFYDRKTTQRQMRADCTAAGFVEVLKNQWMTSHGLMTLADAYALLINSAMDQRQYLGKAVRWYYATGSESCIVTPSGSRVAKTDRCKPLMTLPDKMPADVDFTWYVDEAIGLLQDVGVQYAIRV